MEIHERISAILSHYGLSVNEFVERAGIKTKQAVYDLLHGKTRSISTAMENKILSCFPDINMIEPPKLLIDSRLAVFLFAVSNKTAPKWCKNAPIFGSGRSK